MSNNGEKGDAVITLKPARKKITHNDKSDFVSFDCRIRKKDKNNEAIKVTKNIKVFNTDSKPQDWIELNKALEECFTANQMETGIEQLSLILATLQGPARECFRREVDIAKTKEDGTKHPVTTTSMISKALKKTAVMIFPSDALAKQIHWMTNEVQRPVEMEPREFANCLFSLSNDLRYYPGATADTKMEDSALKSTIYRVLPASHRNYFDLHGFKVGEHSVFELVEESMKVWNFEDGKKPKAEAQKSKNKNHTKVGKKDNKKNGKSTFYCSHHGKNTTHDTKECKVLIGRKNNPNGYSNKNEQKKSFSGKTFRKEINALSRHTSKRKVLELYSNALAREKKRAKKTAKRRDSSDSSDSDSDSDDLSVNMLDVDVKPTKETQYVLSKAQARASKKNKRKSKSPTKSDEEKAFLKKVRAMPSSESSEDDNSTEE